MRVLRRGKSGYVHIGWTSHGDDGQGLLRAKTGPCPWEFALFATVWVPSEAGCSASSGKERAVLVSAGQDPALLPGWRPVEVRTSSITDHQRTIDETSAPPPP